MQVPYKSLPWVSAMPSQEIGVGGLWLPSNSRMSAAKYSGTGAQAASANSARSPAVNACTNFIGSSEIAGRRRIFVLRPPYVVNMTEAILFRRGVLTPSCRRPWAEFVVAAGILAGGI